ncbi:hypothetical protein EsH8_VI_001167 [Colletotrichum jinshuiense]
MAAAAYTSVRRSSMSSSGSDYSDDAGTRPAREDTKDAAASSSQPSMSATATPSPMNFLSLAETSFTPLSMESDLFPEHYLKSDDKTSRYLNGDGDSSPSLKKQSGREPFSTASPIPPPPQPLPLPATITAWEKGPHAAYQDGDGPLGFNKTGSMSKTSTVLNANGGTTTTGMQSLHAPAASTAATSAPDTDGNVSGARDKVDAAAEIESSGSHPHRNTPSHHMAHGAGAAHAGNSAGVCDMGDATNAAAVEKEQRRPGEGDGEAEDVPADAISRTNPRQRRAGSTPLSLDPLQLLQDARGGSAATEGPRTGTTARNSSDRARARDSARANAQASTNAHASTGASPQSRSQSQSQSHSSPPVRQTQPVTPLALPTKNIHHDINSFGPQNTSSPITSPAASTSSPTTILSAPATTTFARKISTSSSRSNSSLISQIQDSLQQQQQHNHHHGHPSPGSNVVRPVAQPIVRTISDSNAFTLKHPVPDLNCRSGAYIGNVAALEKSAERLSMTSSIEDAIRDLHGELKRSDSRRSSILAASVAASQSPIEDPSAQPGPLRVIPPVASIVELNNAARLGGYSPSGYVMSPNHSLTGRMRSGSKNSSGRPEIDVDAIMSRHGPGKGSTRSARSGKPSLAEIAESEPVALTGRVLDEADHAPVPVTADDDATIRRPNTHYEENDGTYHDVLGGHMDRHSSGLGLDFGAAPDGGRRDSDDRPPTPRSTSTFDQANAFGDFDGVHCQPEDLERGGYDSREQSDGEYHEMPMPKPRSMPMPDIPEPQYEPAPPRMPPPNRGSRGRPQSFFDELTGQEMLYYPARVPAMLNLPPKLSKKPKTDVRNARHSKVLQAMGHPGFGKAEYLPQDPEAPPVRESKMWLPDPLADSEGHRSGDASFKDVFKDHAAETQAPAEQSDPLLPGAGAAQFDDIPPAAPPPTQQRRKSKMPRNSDLPPQLRASAFFDLPSTTPQIQVQGGSAMATLDSILDASANAPVSAFTDHAFAGKLGTEVYGPDSKKKNRKSVLLPEEHRDRAASQRKRGPPPFGNNSNEASRKSSIAGSGDERRALSDNADGEHGEGSADDEEDEEEEEDEFAGVLDGPPTTLLAELQLRKYQQKMRTQNPNRAIPNGMHSTLLELDAVAEAQKKHREKKKIALAWEDGAKEEDASSDDDEVPLGVLYAGQPAIAEMNRPLGLMERRDMEENEPLSARRARLHGQEPPRSLAKQRSNYTLNAGLSQLRLNHMPSTERMRPQEESDDDAVEGETLGERMRRLKAKEEAEHNNLPKARPVSQAFSAEMLTQFAEPEDKGKEKDAQPEEAEETLGQRRKRLQAEREAREREMMLSGGPVEPEAPAPQLRKKHSLADVLGSHPVSHNPAVDEQRRREQEERKVREQATKMAAVRAQMPTSLNGPNVQRTGGYMGGAFNNGTGAGVAAGGPVNQASPGSTGLGVTMGPGGWNRSSMAFSSFGSPLQTPMQQQQQPAFAGLVGHAGITQMSSKPMNGYGSYAPAGMSAANAMNHPYSVGMGIPMQMQPMGPGMGMQQGMTPMQMQQMQQMQMQMQPGQVQNIERWRQSVMH